MSAGLIGALFWFGDLTDVRIPSTGGQFLRTGRSYQDRPDTMTTLPGVGIYRDTS